MTIDQAHISPGWYPDPTGRHELRYFEGHWTQHVCSRGVTSVSTTKRSSKFKLAVACGALAAAVGITLAVTSTGGSSARHGFCADVAALGQLYPSKLSSADLKNASKLSDIASRFDSLAAEAQSPQTAADLRYVANWMHDVAIGDYVKARAGEARMSAASDRINTYVDETCPGLYVNGS